MSVWSGWEADAWLVASLQRRQKPPCCSVQSVFTQHAGIFDRSQQGAGLGSVFMELRKRMRSAGNHYFAGIDELLLKVDGIIDGTSSFPGPEDASIRLEAEEGEH